MFLRIKSNFYPNICNGHAARTFAVDKHITKPHWNIYYMKQTSSHKILRLLEKVFIVIIINVKSIIMITLKQQLNVILKSVKEST